MKNNKYNISSVSKILINITCLSVVILYVSISVYFSKHFYFKTYINGLDVSLKSYSEVQDIIEEKIKDYKITILGRNNKIEVVSPKDIKLNINKVDVKDIKNKQNSFLWIKSLIKESNYIISNLVNIDEESFQSKVDSLEIFNENIVEPKSVEFIYVNKEYHLESEVYGNKLDKEKSKNMISQAIKLGLKEIDLDKLNCYENPKYTVNSEKTKETLDNLNKYVSTKIIYLFEENEEELDGDTINEWITVNDDLDIHIDENKIKDYVKYLSKKYNTIGVKRNFKNSLGKVIEISGGYYGWKINSIAEEKMLTENIKLGAKLKKEPVYSQKALQRGESDIGDTYVEINLKNQYLWFYKDGKVIAEGDIVTGDILKGRGTKTGVYMLNYKQENAILRGENYESKVTYWMPFNGNVGIHDASWRYSFGGEIYKGNGSHGCVNASNYLAKTIFKNIEEGTPIICYSE